ncbi:MAG: hypothetical protein ACJAW3_000017 [Lentimonas sp.]|jgi:uncharacterized protein (DUF2237 family)
MIANDNNSNNILGTKLKPCCFETKTGFYRDGSCNTDQNDHGKHIICAIMTDEFLQFSKNMGNDLTASVPEYNFPGLKAGDKWCLCILRWKEALENDVAPKIILESCHQNCLEYVSIADLQKNSI